MRLINDETDLIDTILNGFLRSLFTDLGSDYKSGFWASNTAPLCPDGETIRNLCSSPSKELKKAWQKQIDGSAVCQLLLIEPKNLITVTPALTALAIATYNFLKIHSNINHDKNHDPALDYSLQLCQTIPPAANPVDGIIYDNLIEPCCQLWRKTSAKAKTENSFLAALLRTNPFSELKNLDLISPAPIKSLAESYLPHLQENQESPDQSEPVTTGSNDDQKWWIQAEKIILNPPLKRILRDPWLTIPENTLSCIGLGIFFEELRRRGKKQFRTPILEFFEAYDFLQRHQMQPEGEGNRYQRLTIIRHLLESKNREHNRKGNEYFLKFRALLEIIASEQAIPREFRHLSREFCLQHLAPLSSLATVIGGEREAETPTFGAIQFSDQPEPGLR